MMIDNVQNAVAGKQLQIVTAKVNLIINLFLADANAAINLDHGRIVASNVVMKVLEEACISTSGSFHRRDCTLKFGAFCMHEPSEFHVCL